MKWLLRDALVYDSEGECFLPHTSIVVEDEKILDVLRDAETADTDFARVVDGSELLVLPGFVNAHLHSHDRFDKGRFDDEPLETWMALYNTPLGNYCWTEEDVYLRTQLNCIDLLRSGTTLVIDDVRQPLRRECVEAVYRAYHNAGLRALASAAHTDAPYATSIPFLEDTLPESWKRRLEALSPPSPGEVLALWRELGDTWRGRVRFAVSPSAAQRCTEPFLRSAWDLARDLEVPVLSHLLETRVQKATSHLYHGESMVAHMDGLGLLTPYTILIHAVWVTDEDIERIAASGAGVVHCPVSNMKLGSGIAPVRKLLDAGIPVGIGTDNNAANDNANILEAMKAAALLSRPEEPDKTRWLTTRDSLRMATLNGAKLALAGDSLGALKPGMRADFIAFSLSTRTFTPLNDPINQLVLCENGGSLSMVVVDGAVLLENGRILSFDENLVMEQARRRAEEIAAMIREGSREGPGLARYVAEACAKTLASHPTTRSLL